MKKVHCVEVNASNKTRSGSQMWKICHVTGANIQRKPTCPTILFYIHALTRLVFIAAGGIIKRRHVPTADKSNHKCDYDNQYAGACMGTCATCAITRAMTILFIRNSPKRQFRLFFVNIFVPFVSPAVAEWYFNYGGLQLHCKTVTSS